TAKWSRSEVGVNAAAAADTPATSVPVTIHVGGEDPWAVAAMSPASPLSVRTTPPRGFRSASAEPPAVNRAYTPLDLGPPSISLETSAGARSCQVPTTSASESEPELAPITWEAKGTFTATSSRDTRPHATD